MPAELGFWDGVTWTLTLLNLTIFAIQAAKWRKWAQEDDDFRRRLAAQDARFAQLMQFTEDAQNVRCERCVMTVREIIDEWGADHV